jgi:hypothetical protein
MILALLGIVGVACPGGQHIPVARGASVEIVAAASDVAVTVRESDVIAVPATGVDCRRLGNVVRLEVTGSLTNLSVKIPEWMPVKVSAVSGDVRIDGARAAVDVDASRGDIWIRGGRDRVSARTASGAVDIEGAQGEIDIQAQHRPVRLASSAGDVRIVNVTGVTTLVDVRARRLEASTVTGEIVCGCAPAENADWTLRANTGAVRLSLPASVDAVVTFDSPRNAAIANFPGATLQRLDSRQVVAVIGKDGARIRLSSFSGAVFLSMARP